jgi:hypothetical protein
MKIKMPLVIAVACLFTIAATNVSFADDSLIKAQLEQMQKQIDTLKAQLNKQKAETAKDQAVDVEKKPEEPMVGFSYKDPFHVRVLGGEISVYGLADVSFDYVNNGLKHKMVSGNIPAQGKMGWMPEVSSNLSYFGIRGSRPLLGEKLSGVFQFETEIAYSYTPGETSDSQQKGSIGSRNSYVGLWSPYGAIKLGKTDAPYKTSTARMDPFDRTLGDYNAIIGNSGGDNRAEFDTRLAHAVWYESPNFYGFNVALLWAPGQNRGYNNDVYARGETNCTGGNNGTCNDGGYGNAFSGSLTYTNGPLYIVGAAELHQGVNRLGDEAADSNGIVPITGVHDEYALKAGIQYRLALTGTTFNFLYEYLRRSGAVSDFDERTRSLATWVAITQELGSPSNVVNLGWAHAGKTPGSPWYTDRSGNNLSGHVRNSANMWSIGFKHYFNNNTNIYLVGTQMLNTKGAHYDLGASGHGTVVDDKDGYGNTASGTRISAITAGMQFKF